MGRDGRERFFPGAAWNLLNCGWSWRQGLRKPGTPAMTNLPIRGTAVRTVALNRHTLPFALALIAGALFIPVPVHGVTLGNVASLSPLGHPLRVVIPVALSAGEALHIVCVKLVADNSAPAAPQIVTGRVSLEQSTTGPRLVITSPKSVSEPALRLALQVGCSST